MLGKVEICGVNTAKLPTLKSDEMTGAAAAQPFGRRACAGNAHSGESAARAVGHPALCQPRRERRTTSFRSAAWVSSRPSTISTYSQNVRFSTYGVPMIIGEIRRYLRDNSAIRVSRSMRDTAYRVLQAREKLQRENQREPTVEQIAKELDLPREEVVFAMDAVVDPVSSSTPSTPTAATPSA